MVGALSLHLRLTGCIDVDDNIEPLIPNINHRFASLLPMPWFVLQISLIIDSKTVVIVTDTVEFINVALR